MAACASGVWLSSIVRNPDVDGEQELRKSPTAFDPVGAVNCPGRVVGRFDCRWWSSSRHPCGRCRTCSVSRGCGRWDVCIGWSRVALLLFVVVRLDPVGIGVREALRLAVSCRWV